MEHFADISLADFAKRLSEKVPAPGGGAVAAVTLAHSAALGAMVLRYTVGRTDFAKHEADNLATLHALDGTRVTALLLADRDAAAYAKLSSLWKLPASDPVRKRDFDAALHEAIAAPSDLVKLALRTAQSLSSLPLRTNPRLGSDLVIAASLAAVAADAAAWNVRVNISSLTDAAQSQSIRMHTDADVHKARTFAEQVAAAVQHAGSNASS